MSLKEPSGDHAPHVPLGSRLRQLLVEYVTYSDTPPEQERAFREHTTEVMARTSQLILSGVVAGLVLWWPTDFIFFRDEPEAALVVGAVRAGTIFSAALCAGLLRWVPWCAHRAAHVMGLTMMGCGAFVAHQLGSLGSFDRPWFYLSYAIIPLTTLLAMPIVPRVLYTAGVALAFAAGFLVGFPAHLASPHLDTAIAFQLFVVLFCVILGHGTYHLVRTNFFQARELDAERQKSERLLLNILPGSIASRLKAEEQPIADGFEEVTVLFADIAGFTRMAERQPPDEVVSFLNAIFSRFDELAEKHGLEKIKTIGDAYMAAAGLPVRRADHAEVVAEMALDMVDAIREFKAPGGEPVEMRIGINTGSVVAGVIGTKKFIYDLWGDTVNTASRMESHGIPGGIQVSASTRHLLPDRFVLEARGEVEVKGKGAMATWLLVKRR